MREIGEAVSRLKVDLGQLKNERFASVFFQATFAALRSDEQEKLEALRNAVINTASGEDYSNYELIFIRFVDELAPAHVRLLRLLASADDLMLHAESYPVLFERLREQLTVTSESHFRGRHRCRFSVLTSWAGQA
jgi:hypothetical protein